MDFSLGPILSLLFCFIVVNGEPPDAEPAGPTHPGTADSCNAWHTVKNGEYCSKVEEMYGISHDDFMKWNPDVSDDCASGFWAEYSYCVSVGKTPSPIPSTTRSRNSSRRTSTAASTTTSGATKSPPFSSPSDSQSTSKNASSIPAESPSSVTTSSNSTYSIRASITSWNLTATTIETAFPPKKTLPGQPKYCADWHLVRAADTCERIIKGKVKGTKEEFHEWNPGVGSDCSGLYVGWWVCVRIQPQTVTAEFEYITTPPQLIIPPYTGEYTPTTFPEVNASFTATPTQSGLAQNCQAFHQAEPGDTCSEVLEYGFVSKEQFFKWNPALDENCDGLLKGYWYCVATPGFTPAIPTVTARPFPVATGQPGNCTSWYRATNLENCDDIIMIVGTLDKKDLLAWNPGIGSQCRGLKEGVFYCVGIPGSPTTRTGPVPTPSSFPTENPTQSGMASNCEKKWFISESDTCERIYKANGITLEQFLSWNPAIGTTSCDNLIPDVDVCVKAPAPSSSGDGNPVTPTPTAENGKRT